KSSSEFDNMMRESKDDRRSDANEENFGFQECVIPNLQYMALERSLEKTVQAMIERLWCKAERLLNNTIRDKDWNLIVKTWKVIATRVFMLRVA
ncbi:12514_t:CDS:2, partial [Cetraspora pellucida]